MKLAPIAVFSVALACFSSQAMAGSDSGLYVGGAIGTASVSTQGVGFTLDEDDTGTKFFAGYNLGLVPFLDIAVEGGYTDFGAPEQSIAGVPSELSVSSFSAVGLVGGKLGLLGVYGKMGLARSDLELKGIVNYSDTSTDPVYGIGAKLQFASLAVRAEFERYGAEDVDVDFLSIGAYFTF